MAKAVPVAFELRSLAELLQSAYGAADLAQIARALRSHVRDGLPVDARSAGQLEGIEHHAILALEDLYLAGLHPDGPLPGMNPSLSERIRTAGAYYTEHIEAAARMLERAGADGSVLRAAAPAIAEAARQIVRRRSHEYALEIARDQQRLGAPASILFGLDGRVVWANHALTELTETRGASRANVLKAATRFAAPLCAGLRARKEPTSRAELRHRVAELGVHFRATVMRRSEGAGEALLLLELSEAKRTTELSPREIQVATLVSKHCSYKETAKISNVSLDSVRTYIRRIYRKFGVTSRVQLKARMIREGMLKE